MILLSQKPAAPWESVLSKALYLPWEHSPVQTSRPALGQDLPADPDVLPCLPPMWALYEGNPFTGSDNAVFKAVKNP